MCMGLVVTVTAYGSDIWAAITQRKRELIDDKSQVINKTVSAESGCSLTIDNVAGGGGTGYFYFSIHSGDEPFTNGLKYERLQVMYKTSPALNVTYSEPVEMGDWYTIYDDGEDMGGFLPILKESNMILTIRRQRCSISFPPPRPITPPTELLFPA